MENEMIFHSEEEYRAYVRRELEDSLREAADPNTKWVTWEESEKEAEALLYELGCYSSAQSA